MFVKKSGLLSYCSQKHERENSYSGKPVWGSVALN